jgi:hypothetical protein
MAQTTSSYQSLGPPAEKACRHHTASVRHEKAASDVIAAPHLWWVTVPLASRRNLVVCNTTLVPAATRKTVLVARAAYRTSPPPSGTQAALRYRPD